MKALKRLMKNLYLFLHRLRVGRLWLVTGQWKAFVGHLRGEKRVIKRIYTNSKFKRKDQF
jgi:hypothetical protein